jgi:protein-L-isoaspartate(D-aspartate) O-methyltransferase
MTDLVTYRQFYGDEIAAIANVLTPALVQALATVPRERFLPPGPWLVRGEQDMRGPRQTPNADPRHVYHNYSIAIDLTRQLFNGAPGVVVPLLDAVTLRSGARVLHVGAGLGYYTALIAHVCGPTGRVLALEVDAALATQARANLADTTSVEVRHEDGTARLGESFDAIFVSAGVTHPQEAWLDALAPDGRLLMPLTATMPAMGTIGKGFMTLVTRTSESSFTARALSMTAIYSGIGLRDEALNAQLGQAMARSPFPPFTRLRRDRHDTAASCWLHSDNVCLTSA